MAANSGPQWLWTLAGCRYLMADQIEQFNTQMNTDLHGCQKTSTPLADFYKCGDGGAYAVYWQQRPCDEVAQPYRKRGEI